MGRLVVQEFVSLDGFAADADNRFAFIDPEKGPTRELDLDTFDRLKQVHAIILGAQTYRMFVDFWPTPASDDELLAPRINELPKIVFSRRLDAAPWGRYDEAMVVSENASDAVRRLKADIEGDLILWGSLTLLEGLLDEDLVDVVRLTVVPVVLGAGRGVFPPTFTGGRLSLERAGVFDSELVALEYSVLHEL